jgi:hypothetical protein
MQEQTRVCKLCKEEKPIHCFAGSNYRYRLRTCSVCRSNRYNVKVRKRIEISHEIGKQSPGWGYL